MGWSKFQKLAIIQREFTNLESHVMNGLILVVVKDSQKPLHALDGSWIVVIKTRLHEDFVLHLYEGPLGHSLLLLCRQQGDHPGEAGGYRLLEFSRHQDADGRQGAHMMSGVSLPPHVHQIAVKDRTSLEEGFGFIILLHM